MSMFEDTRSVERPRFFDGQQLFAADLDGIAAFNRAMRWLHNRSLHQAGVGNGFAVSGRRGDRQVRVQPGYALDADGREIVLLESRDEQVPPVAGDPGGGSAFFDLAVSYPSDDELEPVETRAGVCVERGAVRLRERPVFCWIKLVRDLSGRLRPVSERDALAIQNGLAIVLAQAEVRDCELAADIEIAVRRTARPAQQPRIACGTTRVEWELWATPGSNFAYGLRGVVDTRSGHFRQMPRYAARVDGVRPLELSALDIEGPQIVALDISTYVDDATPDSFTCLVPTFRPRDDEFAFPAPVPNDWLETARRAWRVTWLGVED